MFEKARESVLRQRRGDDETHAEAGERHECRSRIVVDERAVNGFELASVDRRRSSGRSGPWHDASRSSRSRRLCPHRRCPDAAPTLP